MEAIDSRTSSGTWPRVADTAKLPVAPRYHIGADWRGKREATAIAASAHTSTRTSILGCAADGQIVVVHTGTRPNM
jgi:hypothetical protein